MNFTKTTATFSQGRTLFEEALIGTADYHPSRVAPLEKCKPCASRSDAACLGSFSDGVISREAAQCEIGKT